MARQPATIKTPFLDVITVGGDVRVYEDDLPRITDAHLKRLRMTREMLHQCFAEGVRLMKDRDWAKSRPIAEDFGTRGVIIVGYNQYTHPLMLGPASGNA